MPKKARPSSSETPFASGHIQQRAVFFRGEQDAPNVPVALVVAAICSLTAEKHAAEVSPSAVPLKDEELSLESSLLVQMLSVALELLPTRQKLAFIASDSVASLLAVVPRKNGSSDSMLDAVIDIFSDEEEHKRGILAKDGYLLMKNGADVWRWAHPRYLTAEATAYCESDILDLAWEHFLSRDLEQDENSSVQ